MFKNKRNVFTEEKSLHVVSTFILLIQKISCFVSSNKLKVVS